MKSACRNEHKHVDPDLPQKSNFLGLPKEFPIDWFEPEYWNKLMVGEHAKYIECGIVVALPLADHCQTLNECRKWKTLEKMELMEKYGNKVLAQYKMPTNAEIEQYMLLNWEDEDGEDGEDDDGIILLDLDKEADWTADKCPSIYKVSTGKIVSENLWVKWDIDTMKLT